MSIENVQTFMTKAENNPELQERISRIATLSELTPEALARLGEEIGTPFTAEEFLAVSHEHSGSIGKELSDDTLASVSGGVESGTEYDGRSSSQIVTDKLKALGLYREKKTSSYETVDPRFIKPPGAANPS